MGSNPAWSRAFLFFFSLSPTFLWQWSGLNQVPQGGALQAVCCESYLKNGCLAVQPGAQILKNKKRLILFLSGCADTEDF